MPRFVPISTFKAHYHSVSDLLDPTEFERFRNKILQEENRSGRQEEGFDTESMLAFIGTLNEPGVVLFYDWVESNRGLLDVLKGRIGIEPFSDANGIVKHRYFQGFRKFISPFLSDALIRLVSQGEEIRNRASSYFILLDDDSRILIEDLYFKEIRERLNTLKAELKNVTEEAGLSDLIHPLCSNEIIALINSFSKSSYSRKLEYVDSILSAVKSKACTVRLANWIMKAMEKVSLNKEHEYKIVDLRRELREGQLRVRNDGSNRRVVRSRDVVTATVLLLLGGTIFYLLYFKPFSNAATVDYTKSASFKKLTKEERMRVDSLIQTIKTSHFGDETEIDPNFPEPVVGPVLSIRKPFRNKKMETLYEDLNRDAHLQEQSLDSCTLPHKSFTRYPGVQDLSTKNGKVRSVFRNNSDYDALLYVADDKENGKVYSLMIKKGESVEIRLDKGDALTLVFGNHFSVYEIPRKTGGLPLPSSDFKHHFCDTDVNYGESINISYLYADNTRNETKFLITGSAGTYVQLVDMYDVLEDYGY